MSDLFSDGLKSLENVEFQKCSICNKTTPILISEKCITCHDKEIRKDEREKMLKFIEEGLDIYKSEAGSKIVFLDCIEGMIEELRGEP